MRKYVGLFVALSLILAVPGPASAQENAGEDEYTEGVPGGGGETPSGETPSGPGSGSSLPPSITSQFEEAGVDGAAAAALAQSGEQGAPAGNGGSDAGSQSNSDSAATDTTDDGGLAGAVKEILDPGSDSGLGIWLPIILGIALLAALVAGFTRFRNSRTPA